MTAAEHPPKDAYLLNILRRREDVLWAGERADQAPTVIARDVEAVRSQLPPAAGEGWTWVNSRWSWADVKAASAEITRLGTRIRSMNVGPRDDDTFGITLELEGPDSAVAAYVATLEPGLVRIAEPDRSDDPGFSAYPSAFPAVFQAGAAPFADLGDLDLGDPLPPNPSGSGE